MVSSVWGTLAMALTTTTGCCERRPSTMEATRSMALASSTEVPPNFMTIIGGTSLDESWERRCEQGCCARDPSLRLKNGRPQDDARLGEQPALLQVHSSQVSFGFQQFGIQDGGACGSANRVVRQDCEFPVQYRARTQAPNCCGHARAQIDVETGLWTVVGFEVDHWLFRRARQLQFLRLGAIAVPGLND